MNLKKIGTALLLAAALLPSAAASAAPRPAREGEYYRTAGARIAPERAEKIAFDRTGGGVLVKLDYKIDKHGYAKYGIHIHKDGLRYKMDVDAMTGDIVKYEQKLPKPSPFHPAATAGIGREKAEQIARDRANGGTVVGCKFDREKNGRIKYDVGVVSGGMKYDFRIDATTGEIYRFKQEPVRRY